MKLKYSPYNGLMVEVTEDNMGEPNSYWKSVPVLRVETNQFIYQIPGTDIELAIDHYHNFDFPRGVSD